MATINPVFMVPTDLRKRAERRRFGGFCSVNVPRRPIVPVSRRLVRQAAARNRAAFN